MQYRFVINFETLSTAVTWETTRSGRVVKPDCNRAIAVKVVFMVFELKIIYAFPTPVKFSP